MKTLLTLLILNAFALAAHAIEKPNIVLIFIDDMGYGDIGPFGNTVNQTPHLDRMAKEGNVLREFYVANTACTPSRAALMTGTYAHRIGMDGTVCFPGEHRGLNPDEVTMAEMLKENGYATGCFGKWHLGDQIEFLPLAHGFDEYFGIPYSNDMWPGNERGNPLTNRGPYTPLPIVEQNEVVSYVSDGEDQALLCEVFTDRAVEFIEENKSNPFFCFVPHAYVHRPRYARPDILEAAEGNVDRANVEEVDTSVGRILDKLRELKIDKNTLVLFTSDNGGAGGMSMGPLRGGKGGHKFEGHMRVPTITWWPGTIPAGSETNAIGVTTDLFPTFAKLAGATSPADRPLDGKDVRDLLLGKPAATSPHKVHFYEIDGIRRGPWKLVKMNDKTLLFNLKKDLSEKRDLSARHPELVAELNDLLENHAESIAANTRPAGFIDKTAAKPLISEPGNLPRLRDFVAGNSTD
ncbi:MAG: sulfatase [Verrucomicrobiota bacterium]